MSDVSAENRVDADWKSFREALIYVVLSIFIPGDIVGLPTGRITDAYLVSVNGDHKQSVERKLRRTYDGIATHDMELVHQRLVRGQDPLRQSPEEVLIDEVKALDDKVRHEVAIQ